MRAVISRPLNEGTFVPAGSSLAIGSPSAMAPLAMNSHWEYSIALALKQGGQILRGERR